MAQSSRKIGRNSQSVDRIFLEISMDVFSNSGFSVCLPHCFHLLVDKQQHKGKMSELVSQAIQFINKLQREYYTTPYDELIALGFLGRVKLYDWRGELAGLGLVAFLILLFVLGAKRNQTVATSFIKAIKPTLDENFHQVGVSSDELYIKDSAQVFTSYATGRINIAGLTVKINLASRQNLFFYLTELIVSNFFDSIPPPEDQAFVIAKPHKDTKIGNYIFAIVNKEGMNLARESNYFLSLTKTTESPELPVEFVFMSESAELNSALITPELTSALSRSGKFLKYLAITDLGVEKPTTVKGFESSPELILSLTPKADSTSLAAIKELVEQLIALADRASKFQLKTDQQKKINNVRSAEIAKIEKAIQERKNEELKEQRLEAEKEARRNLAKISPEAQEKLDKKQREKRERRAKSKQIKRA